MFDVRMQVSVGANVKKLATPVFPDRADLDDVPILPAATSVSVHLEKQVRDFE